ncbi:MAG: hypothetical protein U1E76_02455 [Planctomycetota bacterium]
MRSERAVRVTLPIAAVFLPAVLGACWLPSLSGSNDAIRFTAASHQDLMRDCAQCHDELMHDPGLSAARRSLEQKCLQCHAARQHDCGYCHTEPEHAGTRPDKDRALHFPHQDHLPRVKGNCQRCHTPSHAGDAHPMGHPSHTECFQCHPMQKFFDELQCSKCHAALYDRLIRPVDRFQHDKDWVNRHGEFTRMPRNLATCQQCHDDNFCADCHQEQRFILTSTLAREKVAQNFIHPGDWIHRHMTFARARPETCLTCHSTRTCLDCHQRQGVALPDAASRSDGFHFHGPGLLDPTSKDFHGRAARRDIVLCASCHDNGLDANCVQCHRVGGVGGNPHPPGFASTLSRSGAKVCRACHFPR